MDLQLTGKIAIVTGGTRGIGKAIARSLAGEGMDVAIVGRDLEAAKATASEISSETGSAVRAYAGIPARTRRFAPQSPRSVQTSAGSTCW